MFLGEKILDAYHKTEEVDEHDDLELGAIFEKYGEWLELKKNRKEINEERVNILRKDEKLKEKVVSKEILQRFIRRYCGVEVELKETDGGLYEVLIHEKQIEDLPENYAYKGGMARFVLERFLAPGKETEPRDLDLIYLGAPDKENKNLSNALAEKYMFDDYVRGNGVEAIEDDYFKSRDFTINEIIYDGHKIVLTKECLLDTVRGIIRITEFAKKQGDTNNRKLLAKAVRFLSDKLSKKANVRLADEDALQVMGIDDFHMALHLDRAMGQGYDIAKKYLQELHSRGLIDNSCLEPSTAVSYFSSNLNNFVFQYANISKEQDVIDNWDDSNEHWDKYDDVRPMKSGFGKR